MVKEDRMKVYLNEVSQELYYKLENCWVYDAVSRVEGVLLINLFEKKSKKYAVPKYKFENVFKPVAKMKSIDLSDKMQKVVRESDWREFVDKLDNSKIVVFGGFFQNINGLDFDEAYYAAQEEVLGNRVLLWDKKARVVLGIPDTYGRVNKEQIIKKTDKVYVHRINGAEFYLLRYDNYWLIFYVEN